MKQCGGPMELGSPLGWGRTSLEGGGVNSCHTRSGSSKQGSKTGSRMCEGQLLSFQGVLVFIFLSVLQRKTLRQPQGQTSDQSWKTPACCAFCLGSQTAAALQGRVAELSLTGDDWEHSPLCRCLQKLGSSFCYF